MQDLLPNKKLVTQRTENLLYPDIVGPKYINPATSVFKLVRL
jgi:hypothetical protein